MHRGYFYISKAWHSTQLFQFIRFIFNAMQNEQSMEDFGKHWIRSNGCFKSLTKAYMRTNKQTNTTFQILSKLSSEFVAFSPKLKSPNRWNWWENSRINFVSTSKRDIRVGKLCFQRHSDQVTELFVSYGRHKEELMLKVLEVFSGITIVIMERGIAPWNPPSNKLLLECCTLLEEEARNLALRSHSFYCNGYVSVLHFASAIHLIDSTAFLLEKLSGYTQCCSPNTTHFSQPHSRSFASFNLQLLEKTPCKWE